MKAILKIAAGSMLVAMGFLAGSSQAQAATDKPAEQIAFLNAVNDHEIMAAREAVTRQLPEEVKNFADMMTSDHQANMDKTNALASKLGITPETTQAVSDFKLEHEKKLAELKKADNQAFPKKYMDAMVDGHAKVMKMLDDFIASSDGELKAHFTETRAKVAEHHDKAESIRDGLK